MAAVAERITLRWPAEQPSGLLINAEICGSEAYLANPGHIDVMDLDRGAWTRRFSRRGSGPGEFIEVRDLAVDCARDRLYVVDPLAGVLEFERLSGQYLKTYPRPASFNPSIGRRPLLSEDGGAMYLAGVWPSGSAGAYVDEPRDRMYRDSMLMWRLDLAGGEDMRMVAPIEPGCVAPGEHCSGISLDRAGPDTWFMAQGGGTRAAVLSTDGTVTRVFDIRSPRFLRDGAVSRRGSIAEGMAWRETNSTIEGVYAWENVVATVHRYTATTNWQGPDDIIRFNVFMNLHDARTGEGLVSDIRLPDLPVGRDGEYLLVLDYGSAGGRRHDTDQLDLVKIPIGPEAFIP